MFSRVFATLGPKNTVNTDVFGGSEAQNHGVSDVVLPLAAKITYLPCFWPAPSKNTVIYAGFTMLQDVVSISKKEKKYCKLQCFGSALRVRGGRRGGRGC